MLNYILSKITKISESSKLSISTDIIKKENNKIILYYSCDLFEIQKIKNKLDRQFEFRFYYDKSVNILYYFYPKFTLNLEDSSITIDIVITKSINLTVDLDYITTNKYIVIFDSYNPYQLYEFINYDISDIDICFNYKSMYDNKKLQIKKEFRVIEMYSSIFYSELYNGYKTKQFNDFNCRFYSDENNLPLNPQNKKHNISTYNRNNILIRLYNSYFIKYELYNVLYLKNNKIQFDISITGSCTSPEGVRSFPRLNKNQEHDITMGLVSKEIAIQTENKYDFNLTLTNYKEKNNYSGSYSYYLNYYFDGEIVFDLNKPLTKSIQLPNNCSYNPNKTIDNNLINQLEKKHILIGNNVYYFRTDLIPQNEDNFVFGHTEINQINMYKILNNETLEINKLKCKLLDIDEYYEPKKQLLIEQLKQIKINIPGNDYLSIKDIAFDNEYKRAENKNDVWNINEIDTNTVYSCTIILTLENDYTITFYFNSFKENNFNDNTITNNWNNGFTISNGKDKLTTSTLKIKINNK